MPHHPSEENAPSGIYEKVAKDPSSSTESTASDHASHDNEHTPGDAQKARVEDLQSKGPAIPMNMADFPPKASREETDAKMEELNK